MFIRKAGQFLSRNAIYTRVRVSSLLAQTPIHNQVMRQTIMQQKCSFGFAQITKEKVDEVMQLYTKLRQKPIEYIYSESLKLVEESQDNIKNYLVLNLITRAALEAKQFDKAIELSLLQIEYLKKEESKSHQIATCLYDLSLLYFQKQKMTLAFQYAFEAEEMADELYQDNPTEFEHLYLQTNNNIANIFLHSQNFEKSLDYSNVVVRMDVQDTTHNLLQKFTGFNLQTQAFQAIQNEQSAHLSAEKAYILAKKQNLESHRAYLFANLGYVFTELKKFSRAKEILNESIEIYIQSQGKGSKNIQNLQNKIKEIEEIEKQENTSKQTVQPLSESEQVGQHQTSQQQQHQENSASAQHEDKATQFFKQGMYKEAQQEFQNQLLNIDNIPQNERKQYRGAILNRIFTCQYLQNNYDESLVTALESLECVIDDENVGRKAKACQNVGIAYEKTGEATKAIEYFTKAFQFFDEKSPNLDKYQVLVNLMRLHKLTQQFDQAVNFGEQILTIINSSNLSEIEIGRFKSGLSEAYYLNNQIEESFRMGEKALEIIEKVDTGSKSHLYCCFQLLKAYEENEYIERIEKTAKKCLELHEQLFGKEGFDEIKYQCLKSLATFYLGFGKYEECMKYLDPLIHHTKVINEYFDEYISFLILKVQIQQSTEEYFAALELCKNIFELMRESSNNGKIPFNEESAKLYTLRYQLNYQNMNMNEFANNIIEYIEILERERQDNEHLTNHILQVNTVVNQFLQGHSSDHPLICQQLSKYI